MATEPAKIEGDPAEQPDLTQTAAAKELAAAVEGAEGHEPVVAAKPQAEAWEVKKLKERVAKLTAQKKEWEAKATLPQAVTAEAEIQRQIDAKAEIKAREISNQQLFNARTEKVLEAGRADFPDFLDRVETLRSAVLDPTDAGANARYAGLVNGILETAEDDPKISAKLIHLIGGDPETAERLAGLSPVRLGKELAKMAEQPPVEPTSGVAKPPSVVVGGRAPSHVAIDPADAARADRLGMSEWMTRRNAQVAENRKNGIKMA
jgi:hypothetical protein